MSANALELTDVLEASVRRRLKPRKLARRSSAETAELPFRGEISIIGQTLFAGFGRIARLSFLVGQVKLEHALVKRRSTVELLLRETSLSTADPVELRSNANCT